MIKVSKSRGLVLSQSKGFTLIELLVVIAIIGILASVVLASLNSARGKGADAAVKADIEGVRTQAEVSYSNVGSYSGVCTDATIVSQMTGAASAAGIAYLLVLQGTAGDATHIACHIATGNDAYAVSAPMKTAGQYWCVDSTGKSGESATALGASVTVCP